MRIVRTGAMVVAMLMTLAGIIVCIVLETGSGKPDRGGAFRDRSTRFRDSVSDMLNFARPTYWCWSGRAADHYEGMARQQRAHVEELASADLQVADILAIQADRVEQERQLLVATFAALVAGIVAAKILEAQWKASAAFASAIALAFETALVALGIYVALPAVAAAIGAIVALDDAGKCTKKALNQALDTYRRVADDVASKGLDVTSLDTRPWR
jgi:hypothetical protein